MRKAPSSASNRLGSYGERVGRERAARRRAARERNAREEGIADPPPSDDVSAVETEIMDIPMSDLANELSVLAALIMAGVVRSHPEARRRFRDDGIKVNDVPVLSDKAKLRPSDISPEGLITLALGELRVILRPV